MGNIELKEKLVEIVAQGVVFSVANGKLKVSGNIKSLDATTKKYITDYKPEIISYLRSASRPKINNVLQDGQIPLSFSQYRMWLMFQMSSVTEQYNIPAALKLSGQLDVEALEKAINGVIQRHHILRTVYLMNKDGEPVQQVLETQFELGRKDFSSLDINEQNEAINKFSSLEAMKPFELSEDLMLRAHLVTLSESEHLLFLTLNHIAADGWSVGILSEEFGELYRAALEGRENKLLPMKLQYSDYAYWQRNWLKGDVLEEYSGYWDTQLSDIPKLHGLPLDKPRSGEQHYSGANVNSNISGAVTDKLVALCQQEGATLFMGLQSAFSAFLSRYSNETDIVMGTPIANREQTEIAGLIGLFVNTLALRSDLSDNPSFCQLLKRNKSMLLDAYAHQQIPFEQLVEKHASDSDRNYNPLFQIMLVMQNNAEAEFDLPDLKVEPYNSSGQTAKFDLKLSATEGYAGEGIMLTWNYDKSLFHGTTIEKMASDFERLLESLVSQPESSVMTVPMMTTAEIHQQLIEWNGPGVEFETEVFLDKLIEEQVEQTPDAVAVRRADESITFIELNKQANRLAHYLQKQGIRPMENIGVSLDGSIDFMIALLAILKAKLCYVVIASNMPIKRVESVVDDANIKLLISDSNHYHPPNVEVFNLDTQKNQLKSLSDANIIADSDLKASVTPAYILYTSGSTGAPKGVVVAHSGVVEYCKDAMDTYYSEELSGSYVISSPSFDLTVPSLFVPLISGGTVEFGEDISDLILTWHDIIQCDENKLIRLTPSHINVLAELSNIKSSLAKHVFVIGGEPLKEHHIHLLSKFFPGCQAYNHYGPSEGVVGCSIFHIDKDKFNPEVTSDFNNIPIGRSLPSAELYVLNSGNGLVPTGVIGELYIGRPNLALNYYQLPELSAERFITNPLSSMVSTTVLPRLYKSGDLVRWNSNGLLEFIGRVDDQVKVRGFRIELRDIEANLTQHRDINNATAIVRTSADHNLADSNNELICYYTTNEKVTLSELESFLAERLPEYMQPSYLVELEQFPLNANGKIDKKQLPVPTRGALDGDYIKPETETEIVLCEIWQELLNIERVGIKDNFFRLGGHSLLATRLYAKIGSRFDVEVPIKVLFQSPYVDAQAKYVESAALGLKRPMLKPIKQRDSIPLSFSQERLWFLEKVNGPSPLYSMPQPYGMIVGELDFSAFQQAIDALVERHEILRTSYQETSNGEAIQVVAPFESLPINFVDLSHLSDVEQTSKVKQLRLAETSNPINIATDNMLRVMLVKLADDKHVVMTTIHHIASDGWSMAILTEDFSELYLTFVNGNKIPLEPLPIQYADFAFWQRNWLSGEVLDEQLNYWKDKLAGIPNLHSLPLDYPRPEIPSFAGRTHRTRLDEVEYQRFRKFCHDKDATLFMGVESAFAALLSYYSNETDIVVGTVIANRQQEEVANLIGFFANTLVLRTDLSGAPSFSDLVIQTKETLLDAYSYQQVPFEKLVSELAPDRDVSYNPVVQIMIVLQNNEETNIEMQGLKLTPLEQSAEYAKFDIVLNVTENDKGLNIDWSYQTELFNSVIIERMADHLIALLDKLVTQSKVPVKSIDFLSDQEKKCLLLDHNGALVANNKQISVVSLFEEQVELSPDKIALQFEDVVCTYSELNSRANQMARFLIDNHGVDSEQVIGICMDRSIDMVVSILAVLKANAVYLLIDPGYPNERLSYIVSNAGVKILLSSSDYSLNQLFDETVSVLTLDCDDIVKSLSEQQTENIDSIDYNNNDKQAAYIVFTSGSTGKPKGVLIEQRSIVNLVKSQEYTSFSRDEVMGLASNMSFDAMTFELWGGLLNGMTLVNIDKEILLKPVALRDFISAQQVTIMFCTTALVHIVAADCPDAFRSLSYLLFGGEDCQQQLIQKVALANKDLTLIHVYGPSENTTFSLWKKLTADAFNEFSHLPLGKPLNNTHAYVLSAHDRRLAVPVGVVGELYLGGDQLAREYWEQPKLTADAFVNNLIKIDNNLVKIDNNSNQAGILYKTGDLVKRLENGDIEFVGRTDNQVKIRGFRIELGEIEAAMLKLNHLTKVFVMADEIIAGSKQIIAYYTSEKALDEELLRKELSNTLPHYSIPSYFVFLEQLTLTANGKIDTKALPKPVPCLSGKNLIVPRNSLEAQLSETWKLLLNQENICVTDNFFALGGHSLLATRLVSAIYEWFKVDVPLRQVFSHPTLESQAELISSLEIMPDELSIVPVTREQNLPLSFAQKRLWLLDKINARSSHYNIPLALRITGDLNFSAVDKSFEQILQRHEILRTNIVEIENNKPVQIVREYISSPVEIVNLRHLEEKEKLKQIEALCEAESRQFFNLEQDLMIRVKIFQLSDSENVLHITIHHIAADGWSLGLLNEEFTKFYKAYSQEKEIEITPQEIQYADYSYWQNEWLQGEVLEQQLNYWTKQLADIPTVHKLTTDHVRPKLQTFSGNNYCDELEECDYKKLKSLCLNEEASLFMGLYAAFNVLLSQYSNETDIVVGTPIANRRSPQLEKVIGFFVNMLVLRSEVDSSNTFRSMLKQSKETLLQAYAHQDLSFELLTEKLQPERNLSHSPLFQIMLVMQNNQESEFVLPELDVSPLGRESTQAKYDITLSVSEQDDHLALNWNYNTNLFKHETIEAMSTAFKNLLSVLLQDVDQPIKSQSLLSPSDMQTQTVDWNGKAETFASDKTLVNTFEAQVIASPDSIALETIHNQLSYQELNKSANQVAHYLKSKGVCPGDLVGLYHERDEWLLIGLLGILKTGAGYVPIDSKYPKSRVAYMISDARLSCVLTQSALKSQLNDESVQVEALDEETVMSAVTKMPECNLSVENPNIGNDSDALAYVIYTSGSTGNPKGVSIAHRSVQSLLHWSSQTYHDDEISRVLFGTSVCFDLSVFEIWGALSRGGSVLLVENVLDLIEHQALAPSLINTVPSALSSLLESSLLPDSVKVVNVAGEPLKQRLVNSVMSLAHVRRMYNLYGPSEDTTYSTYAEFNQVLAEDEAPSIGKPLPNTEVYVLNEEGHIQPRGVVGELYIAGEGLSKGYLHQQELTADKFININIVGLGEKRVYRTGDLVRWCADGQLSFISRTDYQVKIRGFRIELGEIEHQLSLCAGVNESVVVAYEEESNHYLVAYFSVVEGESVEDVEQGCRSRLSEVLAEYMVPQHFVCLESLPLTSNGKVDRSALKAPQRVASSEAYVAPRTELEHTLCSIWEELLNQPRVSVKDNFFDLGGHSLLAVKLRSIVKEKTGINFQLKDLFFVDTLEEFAELLTNAKNSSEVLSCIQSGDESQRPLFLVHPISGDVSSYRLLVSQLNSSIPVYGLSRPEIFDDHLISDFTTIDNLAEYYIAEIKQCQPDGPYRISGWSYGGVIGLTISHKLVQSGEDVEYLGMIDSVWKRSEMDNLIAELSDISASDFNLPRIKEMLNADLELLKGFDLNYQTATLSEQLRLSESKVRDVILSGLLSLETFTFSDDINIKTVQYFEASKSEHEMKTQCITQLKSFASENLEHHGFHEDHHSIMHGTAIKDVAQKMNKKLFES